MTPNTDYFEKENELTRALFNLDSVILTQAKNDVQIIRGEDYNYMCYINGKVYSVALTPMFALVSGVQKFGIISDQKSKGDE